jgi:hypothetical protein
MTGGDFCDYLQFSRREPIFILGESTLHGKGRAKGFQKNVHAAILKAVLTIHNAPNSLPPHCRPRRLQKDALSAKTEGLHNRTFVDRRKRYNSPSRGRTSHVDIERRKLLTQSKIDEENVWPQLPHGFGGTWQVSRFADDLNVASAL